jgi:hypothetical protein
MNNEENRARARIAGQTMGSMFARISGGGDGLITDFDTYQRAIETKRAAQAKARREAGLESAPFVDFGCEGEPKPRE